MNARLHLRLAALAILGIAAGCSSDGDTLDQVKDTLPVIGSFTASPSPIDFGDITTLSWKTTGARRVVISAGTDVLLDTNSEPNGLLEVTPQKTTTYSLRAISPKGEATSEAKVEVRPTILELTTAAGDGPAVIGKLLAVSWRTAAALEVTLTNDADFSSTFTGAQALQGWVEAPVTETGTFTLTARSGELQESRTITVDAIDLDVPTIVAFEADRPFVTIGDQTEVEVSWSVQGATELRLFVNLEPFALGDRSLEEDSAFLVANETLNLVLRAGNLAGQVETELTIKAEPLPTILSLQAFPARLPAGGSTTLEWATQGATAVELEADGLLLDLGLLEPSGSAGIETVATDTSFLLRAFNRAGGAAERTLAVTIGAPEIVAFGSARPNVAGSVPVDLSWEVLGGSQLSVLDPDLAPIDTCITADIRQIAKGGCQLLSPEELGAYVYTLVVRDSIGQETRGEFVLSVVDGPTIEDFTASAGRIEPGASVILSWEARTDAQGRVPTLALADDRGGSYSLAGLNALGDSIEIAPESTGPYLFTLTASTPGTTAAQASLTVVVEALATISLKGPETYDPGVATSMDLLWTQADAVSLVIWALDEDGNPVEPALLSLEDPDASGTLSVDPLETTTYVAVVENASGTQSEARFTVSVIGPEILTFDATPSHVLIDGFASLSWTTANATTVTLEPSLSYSVRTGTEPYLALSTRATSSQLVHEGNNCGGTGTPGCPLLTFPGGFTFNYNGHTYDRANIFQSGFLSFDLTRDNSRTPASGTNQRLPVNPGGGTNATGWTEVIAPHWGSLNYPAGAGIHYELITDHPRGRFLAIEWHGVTQGSGRTVCNNPLGVNLILWEDGGFDFRYAQPHTSIVGPADALCNGSGASIGFQHDLGEKGVQISYGRAHEGGIANKSWSMLPAQLGTDGGVDLLVPETQIFVLTATGSRGRTVSREVTVQTHTPPNFTKLVTDPVGEKNGPPVLDVGVPVAIEWRTTNVVGLVVEDDTGNVLCAESNNAVPNGGCSFSFATPGLYDVRVIGEDFMGNTVTRTLGVDYREPFRIDSLSVTPDEIRINALAPVTLRWNSVGASSFRVFADDAEVPELVVADPNNGSVVLSPNRTTTFRLELSSADGRVISDEVVASVRTFETGTITAPTTIADGTQPVTIEWNTPPLTTGRVLVTLEPESFAMFEVMDSPFIDISGDGTEIPGVKRAGTAAANNNVEVTFPAGFTFPFFDRLATGVYPATTGYISMRSGSTSQNIQPMNYWTLNFEHVHIAPFHDFLRSENVGTIFHKFIEHPTDPDRSYQLIQWHKMQIGNGSDGSDDLTFQVALYRDGSFEFRYKTMQSTRLPERAGGSTAVAGFHEEFFPASRIDEEYTPPWRGYELFFKPANPISLGGRTFRYQARKVLDSFTVTPEKTTVYNVCFSLEGFKECKSVAVVVPEAGDLVITELNLNPTEGLAGQWFEIRNTTPYEFDIRGMTVTSDSSSFTIAGDDPIMIGSGAYRVLAASANPTLNPDYVYGTSFIMGTAVDNLAISYNGRQVAQASWDTTWSIPAGKTLSLDPRWQRPHVPSNNDSSRWCDGGATGSPRGVAVSCSSAHYNVNHFSTLPFIDISKTGTRIATLSQIGRTTQETFNIPGGLGFNALFFGVPVNNVWVSINGFLALSGSQEPMPLPEPFPSMAVNRPGMIAPLWSPFEGTGTVYYQKMVVGGRQVLVVQWHKMIRNIGNVQNNYPGNTTFQAQLWQNGDIVFSYGEMSAIIFPVAGDYTPQQEHFGGVGTVGIEAIGGQQGFQYLFQEPILRKGQSIAYINKSGTGGR